MSNDPLDSFLVPKPKSPDLDDMPSIKTEAKALAAKPAAPRQDPKVLLATRDETASKPAHSKPVRVEPSLAEPSPKPSPASTKPETKQSADTTKPATTPTLDNKSATPKVDKLTSGNTKQTAIPKKPRSSRSSRFAIYLAFIVATGFVLAITGNAMHQSLQELKQDK